MLLAKKRVAVALHVAQATGLFEAVNLTNLSSANIWPRHRATDSQAWLPSKGGARHVATKGLEMRSKNSASRSGRRMQRSGIIRQAGDTGALFFASQLPPRNASGDVSDDLRR